MQFKLHASKKEQFNLNLLLVDGRTVWCNFSGLLVRCLLLRHLACLSVCLSVCPCCRLVLFRPISVVFSLLCFVFFFFSFGAAWLANGDCARGGTDFFNDIFCPKFWNESFCTLLKLLVPCCLYQSQLQNVSKTPALAYLTACMNITWIMIACATTDDGYTHTHTRQAAATAEIFWLKKNNHFLSFVTTNFHMNDLLLKCL